MKKVITLSPDLDLTNLADLKTFRYEEIDLKTRVLIFAGFTFDGQQFSLSPNAQMNWSEIHSNQSEFVFPKEITTINNDTYSLAAVDVDAFWTIAKDTVDGHIGTGRALKKQIFDAVDIPAVDAIVDNR